jgi:hypothetical protein
MIEVRSMPGSISVIEPVRGSIVGFGIWWQKLTLNGNNVNAVTPPKCFTDLGRAASFYDCLVEVSRLD